METIVRKPRVLKLKKGMTFYLKIGLFLALIFLRNVFDFPIPVSLFLVLGGAIALTGTRDDIITLGICCFPLFTAFQYKYLLLLCIVIYYFKYPKDIKLGKGVLPLVLMMLWELAHALLYNFSMFEYLRNFSELIFCTFLIINSYKKVNFEQLCRLFAICAITMAAIVLIKQLQATNYNFELIFRYGYRLGVAEQGVDNFGINFNANRLGTICSLSIAGLLQLVIQKKQRVTDYIMMFALVFIGAMTMSRSFLVCLTALAFMFIWARENNIVGRVKTIVVTIVVVLFAFYVIQLLAPVVVEQFMERFEEGDISNGRIELFFYYNEHIFSKAEYTFFGVGMQDMGGRLQDIYGITKSGGNIVHNGIQQIIVAWGIPGLFIFIYFLYEMIHSSKIGHSKRTLANFIPLILVLLNAQFGQLITSGAALLGFSFAYINLCLDVGGEQNDIA